MEIYLKLNGEKLKKNKKQDETKHFSSENNIRVERERNAFKIKKKKIVFFIPHQIPVLFIKIVAGLGARWTGGHCIPT
jgi:hypothetical protein